MQISLVACDYKMNKGHLFSLGAEEMLEAKDQSFIHFPGNSNTAWKDVLWTFSAFANNLGV